MNVELEGCFSHEDGTHHDVEEYAKASLEAWLIILPPTTPYTTPLSPPYTYPLCPL